MIRQHLTLTLRQVIQWTQDGAEWGVTLSLLRITELTNQLGISSRSLRYYEQVGLVRSSRPEHEKYRYYDADAVERLKQIMILRKMQIPVKDILRIYEREDMSIVVETFVERIRGIDQQVDALTELRRVVNDFLKIMLDHGVSKISALPILYEKMEKQMDLLEERRAMNYSELSALSERVLKPIEASILSLPTMRMLSSRLTESPHASDPDGFGHWIQARGIATGRPGRHEQFEFQSGDNDVVMLRVPDAFENDGPYAEYPFEGGLFAAVNVYLDEDLAERFRSLIAAFDDNKYYEIDYSPDGGLRHEAMLENLISPDERRDLVSLLVPVKPRLADPALFDQPKEINPGSITIAEIERQNPALFAVNVPLDGLTPINGPHYRVTEAGEAEYTGWVTTRVLSTNVNVTLPFRVDLEFRYDEKSGRYGYDGDEGSIRFYHGDDFSYGFGINMGNRPDMRLSRESLSFYQPIFRDFHEFPGRGAILRDEYNALTWIVGQKHFAVIINGEVRYCGVSFPYMAANLSAREALPILIGSNGQGLKYFRSIKVSQLVVTRRSKIQEGALFMITRRSNNTIPNIRKFITSEHGENYWFNGCGRYVMGALGESDYDYELFAGLTGDVFAQVFARDGFRGDGVTDYIMSDPQGGPFIEEIFARCGYAATFVPKAALIANREMYLQTLMAFIDKGVPVISNLSLDGHNAWIVFVGYEEYGKTLLFQTDNMVAPERVAAEAVFREDEFTDAIQKNWRRGLVFVGEKRAHRELQDIYREAIARLLELITVSTGHYCFGAEAFRTWADEIEGSKFDDMAPEDFDGWRMYSTYVCNAATNGSCCYTFLDRAMELNPDLAFLRDVAAQYEEMGRMWQRDPDGLEAIGGGFNISLETLKNPERRRAIAAKLRDFAVCMDRVVAILEENLATPAEEE